VLLDEVVAEADSSSDPAKDLLLDPPFQKVVRAWREVASPSEAAVSDFLQQHEPPTIAQRQVQPQAQPQAQPKGQPIAQCRQDQPLGQRPAQPPKQRLLQRY
jgi:hypothetical protein